MWGQTIKCLETMIVMTHTYFSIPYELFKFSGQTKFDTWNLREEFEILGDLVYSNWLVAELPFCFQRARDLVDLFPFWQHKKKTGRPPQEERDLMICYLIRQLLKLTFRDTQAIVGIFRDYFGIENVPHHNTMSEKNRSKRWLKLWKRFHKFVLKFLPEREADVATDATGYSGRKKSWRETPHPARPKQDWVKTHTATEVDNFLILSYVLTESDIHDSQVFEEVWQGLPENVNPKRSLADSAYTNHKILNYLEDKAVTPFHGVKSNAVYKHNPTNQYEKLVNFFTHWPNRFQKYYGKRVHAETTYSMIDRRFGYRIRCRTKTGRKNEVQAKINMHNIRMVAAKGYISQL